jgi:hypothetical protein
MVTPASLSRQYRSSIPLRFVIGQDNEGHWLALETHGIAGGLFKTHDAAWRYALKQANYRSDAIEVVTTPLELRG